MYHKYADDIYRFIFVHVRDQQLAEDLTADTFTSAWKHIDTFEARHPRAWLYTIARNRITDHWRKKQTVPIEEAAEIESEAALPDEVLDSKIQAKRTIKAVMRLPQDMKSVIVLRFMQGYSVRQTAEALNLTESNVRVVQYRALKKLKKVLS